MADVLRPDETKLASKGIKSVQSRVGNISSLLKNANGGGMSDSAENTKIYSNPVNAETKSEGANTKILPESADDFRGYLESRFGGCLLYTSEISFDRNGIFFPVKYNSVPIIKNNGGR